MLRILTAAAVALLVLVSCAPTTAPVRGTAEATRRSLLGERDTVYTIRHDSVLRTYVLHAPPGAETKTDLPVVVMLHADGSTSEGAIALTGWSVKADQEGFIVAYPQADRGVWNDGTPRGLAGRVTNGDLGFIGSVLTDVDRHFKMDHKRLYLTGFSTGASVTWLAGAELAFRLGAVAPVGGYLWPQTFNNAVGMSLLHIVPGADPQYPLGGGRAVDAAGVSDSVPPVQQTQDRWRVLQKCSSTPVTLPAPSGVRSIAYQGCRDGTETVFTTIDGLGHIWPGAPSAAGAPLAGVIDVTSLIWEFFRTHPRK